MTAPVQRKLRRETMASGTATLEHHSCQRADSSNMPDEELIKAVANGDEAAIRELLSRYDRLVRYTIFRIARAACLRDRDFLDSASSDTWLSFIHSIRIGHRPVTITGYLTCVARRRVISIIRNQAMLRSRLRASNDTDFDSRANEPMEVIAYLEELARLRNYMANLPEPDRLMLSELRNITERQWRAAAVALGVCESTLRSRWQVFMCRIQKQFVSNALPGGR